VNRESIPPDEPQREEDKFGKNAVNIFAAATFAVLFLIFVGVLTFFALWAFGVIHPFNSGVCS
jgi:hypothetical protein